MLLNATESVNFDKTFKNWVFSKTNRCFLKKTVDNFEITEVMNFPVECNWNSKISQNVQVLGFS